MVNFEKPGVVSVWAGLEHQESKVDLLFDLCGIEYYDVDFQECSPANRDELESVTILANRFSYGESFSDAVVEAARNVGIERVAWLVMQLNYAFDPSHSTRVASGKVKFLGVFSYEDSD
jgi:hypothetical protein